MGKETKTSRLAASLSRFGAVPAQIAAIIGSLGVIGGVVITIYSGPELGPIFKVIITVLNLVALTVYCYLSRKEVPLLELRDTHESKGQYCKFLKADPGDKSVDEFVEHKNDRVNILVGQLYTNVIWYAIPLIIVYIIYAFDNEYLFEKYLFEGKGYFPKIHECLSIAAGVFNFVSAVFLYLGFKVLYVKTVNDNNRPLRYYLMEIIVSAVFIITYGAFSFAKVYYHAPPASTLTGEINKTIKSYNEGVEEPSSTLLNNIKQLSESSPDAAAGRVNEIKKAIDAFEAENKKRTSDSIREIQSVVNSHKEKGIIDILSNLFSLFIGIFNGLAMALLFGRYISMEQFAYNLTGGKLYKSHSKIIHQFIIYILPIYALAQPLFGSFEIDAFGSPLAFANGVFLVCLIGKVVFLYLTYMFMKRRLMHLYLHTVVTSHGLPEDVVHCFDFDFHSISSKESS